MKSPRLRALPTPFHTGHPRPSSAFLPRHEQHQHQQQQHQSRLPRHDEAQQRLPRPRQRPDRAPAPNGAGCRDTSEPPKSDIIDADFSSLDHDDDCALHHHHHHHRRRRQCHADNVRPRSPTDSAVLGARSCACEPAPCVMTDVDGHRTRSRSPPAFCSSMDRRQAGRPRADEPRRLLPGRCRTNRSGGKGNHMVTGCLDWKVKSPARATTPTMTTTATTTTAATTTTMTTNPNVSPILSFQTPRCFKRRANPDTHATSACTNRGPKIPRVAPSHRPPEHLPSHMVAEKQSPMVITQPLHKDSGYESEFATSKPNRDFPAEAPFASLSGLPCPTQEPSSIGDLEHSSSDFRHTDTQRRLCLNGNLPRSLESHPVTCEELVTGAKSIYASLVAVESKCMALDTYQTANANAPIEPKQWSASIALHQKLLHEHHDFFMVTQHPTAPPALRALPLRYGMPARMWKHGIHGHLEVLRSRRPQSQDYMLAFIHLAYQMIALLYETVSSFADTWIECLGDLARYRMAVEEEREAHTQWCTVACRWYSIASDRHPFVGRLNHHLGILERSSVKKLYYYTKALTCAVPFHSAKDSLTTVCTPLMRDLGLFNANKASPESCFVTYHALVFLRKEVRAIEPVATAALRAWSQLLPAKLNDIGVPLALTNISSILFDCEGPQGNLWRMFADSSTPTSNEAAGGLPSPPQSSYALPPLPEPRSSFASIARRFCYDCLNAVLNRGEEVAASHEALPYIHVMLAWFYCLSLLLGNATNRSTIDLFLDSTVIPWQQLASSLNYLRTKSPIPPWLIDAARNRDLLALQRNGNVPVMSEDYSLRGYAWSQAYLACPQWFEKGLDLECRGIETQASQTARQQRVQWLGIALASTGSTLLTFDEQTGFFSAPGPISTPPADVEMVTLMDSTVPHCADRQFEAFTLMEDTSVR